MLEKIIPFMRKQKNITECESYKYLESKRDKKSRKKGPRCNGKSHGFFRREYPCEKCKFY